MKAVTKNFFILFLISCLTFTLFACSNKTEEASGTDKGSETTDTPKESDDATTDDGSDEKVTLKVTVHWDEAMFNERFKEPIEKAFPNITLEQVQTGADRESLEKVFAKGISPDIFFEVSQENLEYFDLEYDLDELIKLHNYDTSHINPVILDALRAKDKEGRLLYMPYEIIYWVLFYNKDVFDLFGQPYPTNNMTWAEAVELGKKLTGERNGVFYRGLDLSNSEVPLMQLSVNLTDPETGEVKLDQPEVAKYFDLLDQIIDLQGENDGPHFDGGRFPEAQTTAMTTEFVQGLNWWKDNESLNMGVAPLPVWADRDPVSHRADKGIIPLSINPNSKHKDAAFKVLTYFTESEYQTWASRNGIGPSSTDTSVLDQFFQDYPNTLDANVASIFEHPPAPSPKKISAWDRFVSLDPARYSTEGVDRNEYLRIIKEESETKIKDAKNSE